jgi:hypothetical protein
LRTTVLQFLRSLLLALGFAVAMALPAAADEMPLQAQPVPLDPVHPEVKKVGVLDYVAGFALMPAPSLLATKPLAPFGGLSDMMLARDGNAILSVSDIGWWWRLRLSRDAQGRLVGVPGAEAAPLHDLDGTVLAKKFESDAESMTHLQDGRWVVGFERDHRLWSYQGSDQDAALPAGPASAVDGPAGLVDLPENNGIEALAELEDGRILMLAEGKENAPGDGIGWLGKPGAWSKITIQRSDGFRPTSLARLPSGDLLLLERYFTESRGPGVRISYLPASALVPGARLEPKLLAGWRLPLTVDNFECLAVEPAADGGLYLFLLSDDNQNPLQRTLLLQFHWMGPNTHSVESAAQIE